MATKTLIIPGFGTFTYDDAVTPDAKFYSDGVVQVDRAPVDPEDVTRLSDVTGAFAPIGASYIVISLDADLTDERRLQVASGLLLTDGGANGDVTIEVDEANIDHDSLLNFVANKHLPGIDEDNMASDSDGHVPTQQSVKAYSDTKIAGDATGGRVLRYAKLYIKDGTNASTLKVELVDKWNGDTIAQVDNLGKGGSSGGFSLDSLGWTLTIDSASLSGNVVVAFGYIEINNTGTVLYQAVYASSNDVNVGYRNNTGTVQDITSLVDSGDILCTFQYITDS